MSDPTGDMLRAKAKAKAAQSPATSRGSGTVPKKGTAIARSVTQRRQAEDAAQARKDAQDTAKLAATAKGRPRRKRTTAGNPSSASNRTPESRKGGFLPADHR